MSLSSLGRELCVWLNRTLQEAGIHQEHEPQLVVNVKTTSASGGVLSGHCQRSPSEVRENKDFIRPKHVVLSSEVGVKPRAVQFSSTRRPLTPLSRFLPPTSLTPSSWTRECVTSLHPGWEAGRRSGGGGRVMVWP